MVEPVRSASERTLQKPAARNGSINSQNDAVVRWTEHKPEIKTAAKSKPTAKKKVINPDLAKLVAKTQQRISTPKPKAKVKAKATPKKRPIKNAGDRSKVSTANEESYQRCLRKVRRGINNKDFDKFTVTVGKRYDLHNERFKRAKRELTEEGLLVLKGKTSYYAHNASAVMAA